METDADRSMKRGKFIVFEGPDGCGKTVQFHKFCEYLKSKEIEFVSAREPGGTKIGEIIRPVLLDPKNAEMFPISEFFLFEAARAQIVSEIIKPALNSNKIVVCDRFFFSTLVYQGYADGIPIETVESANNVACQGIYPDRIYLLDVPAEISMQRRAGTEEGDRIESKGLEFRKKIREGYKEIGKSDKRIIVIDGTKTIEQVHKDIIADFESHFGSNL